MAKAATAAKVTLPGDGSILVVRTQAGRVLVQTLAIQWWQ